MRSIAEEVAGAAETAVVGHYVTGGGCEGAPPGLVCPEGFYVVAGDRVAVGQGAVLDLEGRHGVGNESQWRQ